MNESIVSSRYAKALLRFVRETGNGDKVYSQAGSLVLVLKKVRQLKDYIENHYEIALEKKLELLETALEEPLAMEMERFVRLVSQERRMEYLLRMLYAFLEQYREANNIKQGRLMTAVPAESLQERLEEDFHRKTGAEVHLETEINPEIIGGFVFELDGWRLDASVREQFRLIRQSLIDTDSRIV